MSVGTSGRVVVEIPPDLKRELHALLSSEGKTLKSWFVAYAEEYVRHSGQLTIFNGQDDACQSKR